MKRTLATFLASLLALSVIASGEAASAHAVLVHASPGVSQILYKSPANVTLTFDDNLIDVTGANVIQVTNAKNVREDVGPSTLQGATLSVKLKALPLGTYRVVYRVLSADGHPVSNAFYFYLRKK
jgi:methionine-rich copper-binding protein CopC